MFRPIHALLRVALFAALAAPAHAGLDLPDHTGDGVVGASDLGVLLSDWGGC